MEKEYTILDRFFYDREEELAEDIETDALCLKDKLKNVRQEDMVHVIETLPQEFQEIKIKMLLQLDDLIANYNVKIAYYNKKYYKQGFKDAVALENSCRDVNESVKEQ